MVTASLCIVELAIWARDLVNGGPRLGPVALITPVPFGVAFGGRERLALRTLEALRALGVDARPLDPWDPHPDLSILHVIGAEAGMWEIAALARRRDVPVVVTAVLSLSRRAWRQRLWAPFDRWFPMRTSFRYRRDLLQLADIVLAATSTEQGVIESIYGVSRDRVRILPNGIDDVYFHADPAPFREVADVGRYVLTVGVISRLKGQSEVLAAARAIGLSTVFVGRANDRRDPYVAAFIKEVEAALDCVWYESMDATLLASAYAGSAVFALPSRSEGLPLAA